MPQKNIYSNLSQKWIKKHNKLHKRLWQKHKEALKNITDTSKNIALASLGAAAIISSTTSPITFIPHNDQTQHEQSPKIDRSVFLISDLKGVLPSEVAPLDRNLDNQVTQILSRSFNLPVASSINDMALNTTYGYIGAEQHLARFPGDNMNIHFDNLDDSVSYSSSGMAPGLGAWGYFAKSQSQMSKEDSDREKYYIAVQTFLSKGFQDRFAQYRDFYKFRKMLVVNPQNGKAIVADIGDAGPAPWTGKQLGGSPEIMKYLEREDGASRGPVLYYFINDTAGDVPLGPISVVQ